MDIDLLTKEKIITEKFIIESQYLDNPETKILKDIKDRIEGYRCRQGFVIKFNNIVSMSDLISVRDSLKGEYSINCNLSVDILSIEIGSILLDCKIKMVTDTGILAEHTLNSNIQIFIPTDELMDGFQTIYKKDSSINIEVIGSRDIIYDNNIIINGRLLTHKSISSRLFLYKLNNNDGEQTLNILNKMPSKENKLVHEILGYPTGKQFDLLKLISGTKFTDKQINECSPYGKINYSMESAPLLEIINIFPVLIKNIKNINDKQLSKVLQKTNTTNKNVDLGYYVVNNQDDMKTIINNIKTSNTKNIIINTPNINNLFRAEWVFLLSKIYNKLWIYRPKCISPLKLDSVYLVGVGINIDNIPNIGKIGKNASNLIEEELPESFINIIRTFNEQIYKLYLEYGIRLIQNPKFYIEEIVMEKQIELSKKWELSTKS